MVSEAELLQHPLTLSSGERAGVRGCISAHQTSHDTEFNLRLPVARQFLKLFAHRFDLTF
jgi:hypothetical protein